MNSFQLHLSLADQTDYKPGSENWDTFHIGHGFSKYYHFAWLQSNSSKQNDKKQNDLVTIMKDHGSQFHDSVSSTCICT